MSGQVSPSSPAPASLREALADRYTLGNEIGRGGMATVYVADDLRNHRRVAFKVLDPSLGAVLGAERFLAEIRITAGLQHPNLLPLFESGEAAGWLYYVMPLIEGATLRERLQRERQLPVDESITIARAIAGALDYAHRQGVVHRDLKPENILLQDGQPLVADFGIALAVSNAGGARLTATGMSLGTPQYMSPEQAVVDHAVDGRSDIYSLACVLHELLTGDPPFTGSTVQAVIAKVLTTPPTSVRTVRPSVPAHVDTALAKALAKLPADRYVTAREFADALHRPDPLRLPEGIGHARTAPSRRRVWFAAGAGLLVLAALGVYATRRVPGADPKSASAGGAANAPVETRPSIAVIPFKNSSGDPAEEHFSDGLTIELIGALGKVAGLKVAPRSSVFALKGKDLSARAVAEALHVATVLDVSVRRAGNRLKVTAQLVRASDENVLWSETYDREMKDIFAVQEEIARAIVGALRVQLGGVDGPLVRPGTSDLVAYDLYLKGRYSSYRMTPADFGLAIEFFNQAIARDPTFAKAYAGLADTYIVRAIFTDRPPQENLPQARTAALKALALDSTLAEAHVALASVLFGFDWDWVQSERHFESALALDRNYAFGHFRYALLLMNLARFDQSMAEFDRARELDPSLPASINLARLHLSMGRPARAIELILPRIAANPKQSFAHALLGHAYLKLNRNDEALAAFRQAALLSGAQDSAFLAYGLALTGQRAAADSVLQRLLRSATQRYLPPVAMATAYVGLGDRENAFQWLEKAVQQHAPFVDGLQTFVWLEPLHEDPRWDALLRRIGIRK